MNIVKCPAVVFSFPEGLRCGGVVTWALTFSKRLKQYGISSTIISHSPWPDQGTYDAGDRDDILQCPGNAQTFELNDIQGFLPVYSSVQPCVFVPNYSYGTYGAAALASLDPASDLRVVAFAHADEKTYYDTIAYYEPIISKFIAVSSEIKEKLERLFPLRRNDIVKLAYPVPAIRGGAQGA